MSALDTVRALNLASRKEPPMAMCPRCPGEPVVMTFERPYLEFTCVHCDWWGGFLDPRTGDRTDDLLARHAENKATYLEQRKARG